MISFWLISFEYAFKGAVDSFEVFAGEDEGEFGFLDEDAGICKLPFVVGANTLFWVIGNAFDG